MKILYVVVSGKSCRSKGMAMAIREGTTRTLSQGDRSRLRVDGWRHTLGGSFATSEPLRLAVQIPCRIPPSHPQAAISGHEFGGVCRFIEASGQSDRVVYGRRSRRGGQSREPRQAASRVIRPCDQHGPDDGLRVWPGAAADRGADRLHYRTAWARPKDAPRRWLRSLSERCANEVTATL
jgi:hypothetical protein